MSAAAALVPVLFATNRAKKPQPGTVRDNSEPLYDDGKLGDLTYGTCKVLLPAGRKIGSAEAGLPKEVKEADWTEDVKDKQILVFIHGYNNSFNDAIQTAARVKNDAKWGGPIVAFSWPSFGFVANYSADEVTQGRSILPFIDFLKAAKAAAAIHILAHSMGNRIALEALSNLNLKAPDITPRLGQLIFAAADEDSEVFKEKIKNFSSAGLGRTLYLSSQDPALAASAIIHYDNRAGQAWPPQQLVPYRLRRPFVLAAGLDSIDCSGAGLFENGLAYDAHGYFAQPPAIHDIAAVLQGQTVLQRTAANEHTDGLTKVQHQDDERLNSILTLTDNPPPPVSPTDVWWKLNTRFPGPASPEVASA